MAACTRAAASMRRAERAPASSRHRRRYLGEAFRHFAGAWTPQIQPFQPRGGFSEVGHGRLSGPTILFGHLRVYVKPFVHLAEPRRVGLERSHERAQAPRCVVDQSAGLGEDRHRLVEGGVETIELGEKASALWTPARQRRSRCLPRGAAKPPPRTRGPSLRSGRDGVARLQAPALHRCRALQLPTGRPGSATTPPPFHAPPHPAAVLEAASRWRPRRPTTPGTRGDPAPGRVPRRHRALPAGATASESAVFVLTREGDQITQRFGHHPERHRDAVQEAAVLTGAGKTAGRDELSAPQIEHVPYVRATRRARSRPRVRRRPG